MVGEVKCVKEGSVRGVRAGAWGGRDGERFRLTRIADALAMMCPILLLRLLKKAARLEWTASGLGCAS